MCIITLLGVILSCALLLFGFYNFLKDQTFDNLKNQGLIIKESLKYENYSPDYLLSVKSVSPDTRITIIKPDGVVIFDCLLIFRIMEKSFGTS
jgi:hypothetical protein